MTSGTEPTPRFSQGDRVFSHYVMGWGTIRQVTSVEPSGFHAITGDPLPGSTWYEVAMDKGGVEHLDDADGNWNLARIVPPQVAAQYGYGEDPRARTAKPNTHVTEDTSC